MNSINDIDCDIDTNTKNIPQEQVEEKNVLRILERIKVDIYFQPIEINFPQMAIIGEKNSIILFLFILLQFQFLIFKSDYCYYFAVDIICCYYY